MTDEGDGGQLGGLPPDESRDRTILPGQLSGVLELGAEFAQERSRSAPRAAARPHLRRVSIGRDSANEICVRDLMVSRRHAELRPTDEGRPELVDLDSRNGTFVNGRRVTRTVLEELDVVTVGRHPFRLVGSQLEEYVDDGRVDFRAPGLRVTAPDGRILLEDASFSLDERSLLGVVGPTGSGKSTLLGAPTGFRPADRGTVLYSGSDLYAEYDALRTRIGFVPQEDVVHDPLTARQALSYSAELRVADLLGTWRSEAWVNARDLVAARTPGAREAVRRRIERNAESRARILMAATSYALTGGSTKERNEFCESAAGGA